MSRLISEILDKPRVNLAFEIEELERLAGRPGVDIRLASELKNLYGQKAAMLGLDANDTSPSELYFAMKNHVFENNSKLEKLIGVDSGDSSKEMTAKVIKFIEKRLGKKSIWALKASTARKQLKANPPKKLMKIFKIRSIDSALKREAPGTFYCFAGLVEGKVWTAKYAAQAAKMTVSDFDYLKIKISILAETRQKQLKENGLKLNHIVYSDQESAHIEICPLEKRFKGDTLFTVDTLLNHIRTMVHRAEYFKIQGLKTDFTAKLENIRKSGFKKLENHGHPFGWTTLVHGSSQLGVTGLVQANEPFAAAEDLLLPSSAQMLNLEFWKHPFAMYPESGIIISFNISDMIINAVNELPPEKAYVGHGRNSLQNELFARYLHHEPVKEKAVYFNFPEA